jgi:carboxymethylenebutenolidase
MHPAQRKLPLEAIELYNDFIHGQISRRAFMEGVQGLCIGLAAATIIDVLMPNYAGGQQVSRAELDRSIIPPAAGCCRFS